MQDIADMDFSDDLPGESRDERFRRHNRLLQSGILEPENLLGKIREEKTGLSATDKIVITKDGSNRRATYYDHIHTLFSLYCLDEKQTELMRCLCLVPLSGMDKYRFGERMIKIVAELDGLLQDFSVGKAEDRALLLDCKAALTEKSSHQIAKAIKLEQEAISLLPETTAENALLASNLHANLGGLYHAYGKNDLAAQYMEQGISILEQYGLVYMNQSIAQICNYAVLLCDMGEPDRGLSALRKRAKTVKEYNSDLCSDYAVIQESMGNINLVCGRLDKAKEHLHTAMKIYERIWADEPEWIENKYKEIKNLYVFSGISKGKVLTKNEEDV